MSTLRFEPMIDVDRKFRQDHDYPWNLIGVFPSVDDVARGDTHSFVYTVDNEPSIYLSAESIEGRSIDVQFAATLLNVITLAMSDATVRPGDSVLIPLGIAGLDGNWERDADGVFWIGAVERNDGRRQTFQSHSPTVVPILWSSPLGFPDE